VSGPTIIEKWSREARAVKPYTGVNCEVYDKYDDDMADQLDTFSLAVTREIPDLRTEHVEKAIREYVDEHNMYLNLGRNESIVDRRTILIGRLVSRLGESLEPAELYDLLSENVGMTDEEIRACGYRSLAPYFDRSAYAQTIAEFMIHRGTENTTTGNWHFDFDAIDERFGLDLKNDEEMVELIRQELYKQGDIVSEVDIYDNDFDLMFYLNYCPYSDRDELEDIEEDADSIRKEKDMPIENRTLGTLSRSGGSSLRTCAAWRRKEPELDANECKIEAVVELSDMQFCTFKHHMLEDYDFIREHVDVMYRDRNGLDHCLLVLGEGYDEGVLVDSQGSAYARYSSLLPNARTFLKKNIQTMAEELIREGTAQISNGKWIISFEEISQHFDCTVTPTNGIGQMLIRELEARDDLANLIIAEDHMEMSFYLDHAPASASATEKIITLFALMGCNLEDVHIVHDEEEHDLATIVELNQNTLTVQGKTDWADVLSAKVLRIYDGYYGTQIEVSGCKADRLEEFSKMLAGYCTISEYDCWVNQNAEPTNQNEAGMTIGEGNQ
jgi:hypothetical protein